VRWTVSLTIQHLTAEDGCIDVSYGKIWNDGHYETPSNSAIMTRDISSVTTLLEAGAHMLQEDQRCNGPFHSLCFAIILGDLDMEKVLLRNRADPSVGNHCALVWAASKSGFYSNSYLTRSTHSPPIWILSYLNNFESVERNICSSFCSTP